MNAKRDLPHYAGGDRIAGKYQLLRPLGVGGMGVVWVAHNLVLDIHVALKLIRRHLAGTLATERLLREARSAARIAHPGIVRVFDFGTTSHGDPFIVMELLEGETLRDLLDREQRLTPLRAAATLLPVAGALASLDGTGIVHRDMKPDNVILVRGEDDRVVPKLVDFGVAIVPGMERVTLGGLIVGTPDYLAPEQAAGEDIDHRVDVWAFSVVLFEALTGQRPFIADAVPDLLNAILLSPTPSIQDHGVHDPELDAIVARGLEKLRERRWGSMRSLAAALAAWARARGLTEDITGAAVRDRLSEPSSTQSVFTPAPTTTTTTRDSTTEIAARAHRARPAAPPAILGPAALGAPHLHPNLPDTVESQATRVRRNEAGGSEAPDSAGPASLNRMAGPPPVPLAPSPQEPGERSPLSPSPSPLPSPLPSPSSLPSPSPAPRRSHPRAGFLAALLVLGLVGVALLVTGIGAGPGASSSPLPGAAPSAASSSSSSAPASSAPASSAAAVTSAPPAGPDPSSPASPPPTGAPAIPATATAALPATPSASASPPTSSSAATPAPSTSVRPTATPPGTRADPGRIDDLKDPYKPLKDPFQK